MNSQRIKWIAIPSLVATLSAGVAMYAARLAADEQAAKQLREQIVAIVREHTGPIVVGVAATDARIDGLEKRLLESFTTTDQRITDSAAATNQRITDLQDATNHKLDIIIGQTSR